MDLIDKIKDLASNIPTHQELVKTEEATKNALVMPFIGALGYNVFNPAEVIPEYTADIGTKKAEKVDYAIKKDDKIIILIECKGIETQLQKEHTSQLYRYFSATEARFGILTNGIYYQFFSDIKEANKMDQKPFFEFNMLDFEEHQIDELKKFTKSAFSLDDILATASSLKYTGAIKKIFAQELANPSELFVKFFIYQIYDGRITQTVLQEFTEIVKEGSNQFINEKIKSRLKSALDNESLPNNKTENEKIENDSPEDKSGIITTQDELESFYIVKAILHEFMEDTSRVVMRDTKSYCGVLLDDNNRKPIIRLRFDYATKKYIGLFSNKKEERIEITNLNEIYEYADRIKETVKEYDEAVGKPHSEESC